MKATEETEKPSDNLEVENKSEKTPLGSIEDEEQPEISKVEEPKSVSKDNENTTKSDKPQGKPTETTDNSEVGNESKESASDINENTNEPQSETNKTKYVSQDDKKLGSAHDDDNTTKRDKLQGEATNSLDSTPADNTEVENPPQSKAKEPSSVSKDNKKTSKSDKLQDGTRNSIDQSAQRNKSDKALAGITEVTNEPESAAKKSKTVSKNDEKLDSEASSVNAISSNKMEKTKEKGKLKNKDASDDDVGNSSTSFVAFPEGPCK